MSFFCFHMHSNNFSKKWCISRFRNFRDLAYRPIKRIPIKSWELTRNNLSFLTALKSVFIQFKLAIAYSMATIKRELIDYRFLVLFLEFKCANRRPRETFTHPDCQFRNMADKLEVRELFPFWFLNFKKNIVFSYTLTTHVSQFIYALL